MIKVDTVLRLKMMSDLKFPAWPFCVMGISCISIYADLSSTYVSSFFEASLFMVS